MKRILALALALVFMLFALPSGAENAPAYTPGALQQALFSDAFQRGEIITADLQLRVQPDELAGIDSDALARLTQLDDALASRRFLWAPALSAMHCASNSARNTLVSPTPPSPRTRRWKSPATDSCSRAAS